MQKISFTIINPHHAIMHIDNADRPIPQIDSLWITDYTYHNSSTTFLSGQYQDGDTIDLTPLIGRDKSEYIVWLRFGDCVKTGTFEFNGLEYDYCLEAGIHWIHIEENREETKMQYFLQDFEYKNIDPLSVDSVWITS